MEKGRLQCNAQNWLSRIRNQIENGWQQTHTHSTQWCMENSQRILFERKEEKERRRRRRIWIKRFLVKDKWGKWCTKEYTLEIFPLPISFIMHSQFKGVHKVFIILALSLCARGKTTFCMFIVLAWSGFYFLCLLWECVPKEHPKPKCHDYTFNFLLQYGIRRVSTSVWRKQLGRAHGVCTMYISIITTTTATTTNNNNKTNRTIVWSVNSRNFPKTLLSFTESTHRMEVVATGIVWYAEWFESIQESYI